MCPETSVVLNALISHLSNPWAALNSIKVTTFDFFIKKRRVSKNTLKTKTHRYV
jgi:hypothetical protein